MKGQRGGFRGGFKRRREEEQVLDPKKVLLSTLIYLGDDVMPVRKWQGYFIGVWKSIEMIDLLFLQGLQVGEEVVSDVCRELKSFIKEDAEFVQNIILDCATQVPSKMPLYSLLIGS